jgi:hypothetical protein
MPSAQAALRVSENQKGENQKMTDEQKPEEVRTSKEFERTGKEPKRARPEYVITLHIEGSKKETVEKRARLAFGEDFRGIDIVSHLTSRAAQFADAIEQIEEAKQHIEGLRDEMQEILDNTPESLQGGDKYSERETCVQELEDLIGELENVCGTSIDFPGMY